VRFTRIVAIVLVVLLVATALLGVVASRALEGATVERARGVDVGDPVVWVLALGEDAEGRTDAIQLVGIDSRSGAAAIIGIPRDTWLDTRRINEVYGDDGGEATLAAVEELVGVAPDYLAAVDFAGFRDLMGAVGPVTVTTPRGFVSHGVRVREGRNRFDGRQALAYVRHRLSLPLQDFDRSANEQRLLRGVLEGMQRRAERLGYLEELALRAVGALTTDLEAVDLYRLTQALSAVDTDSLTSCVLPGRPDERFGASVVLIDRDVAQAVGDDAEADAAISDTCPRSE
jgi:LCP family protein required for cell wall assembly